MTAAERPPATTRAQRLIVALILFASCAALLLTAPTDGDFWWQDAPRHALNGAFVKDLLAAHPFHDPVGWAVDYYVKYPALTVMFYPPLFYFAEAAVYAVLGVSHFAAQFTVTAFYLLLAISSYRLARYFLPRWSALGVALLLIGAPELAFWGRQVMLDVPGYSLIVSSVLCLVAYLTKGRPRSIYLAAALLTAAIYTKYNTGFIAPAMLLAFFMARGRAALRDRHALIAASITAIALIPAAVLFLKFGSVNAESLSGRPGDLSRSSLGAWLYYASLIPRQLGFATAALAAVGVVLIAARRLALGPAWMLALLTAWFAVGYVFFSSISVREPRHDLMVLFPLVLVAGLAAHRLLGSGRLAQAGLTGLGLATLAYSLFFYPPMTVEGYRTIAAYVAEYAPKDGVVVYSGYRDGNFVFDMREHEERRDLTIVRADKLFLRIAVERLRGVGQTGYTQEQIADILRRHGVGMVVAQVGFWDDLQQMALFNQVLKTPDFKSVAAFQLTRDLSTNDGKGTPGHGLVEILVPTYPVERTDNGLAIDMPFIKDRFQGHIH
ncbi:MAG TPA: glycosyltransferase family 39 protein [Alphaproteobacteria bacterium]|nr:glycosyltransferase family 39 protein [Alphaproteobacteria bacterium]